LRQRAPIVWNHLGEVGLEAGSSMFADLTAERGRRFYRATGAATLEIWMLPGWDFTGPAGAQYRIDYVDLNAIAEGWQFLTTLTLPGSPHLFIDFSATNNLPRYYRTDAAD
jgi:hypothetical protein